MHFDYHTNLFQLNLMVKLVILIHLIALMLDQCHRFQMLQEVVAFGAIGLKFFILKLKVDFTYVNFICCFLCVYSQWGFRKLQVFQA